MILLLFCNLFAKHFPLNVIDHGDCRGDEEFKDGKVNLHHIEENLLDNRVFGEGSWQEARYNMEDQEFDGHEDQDEGAPTYN